MNALPTWPPSTIGMLATIAAEPTEGPHNIPVSAPVRAGDHTILLSLHLVRGTLARLRERPQVALLILAEGDVAFTARGTARVLAAPMPDAPDYAAVELTVTGIDDHRQAAFTVEAGADRRWIDEDEKCALGGRVAALRQLADPHPRGSLTA